MLYAAWFWLLMLLPTRATLWLIAHSPLWLCREMVARGQPGANGIDPPGQVRSQAEGGGGDSV